MSYRTLISLLLALLALATLAACGDDDDDGGTESPAVTTPALPVNTDPTRPPPVGGPETQGFFSCDITYPGTVPDASAFPIDITDDSGRTVTIDAPPDSIASLSAGHTEVLYAIGAGDQVTAVDNTSNCPYATDDLPKVDAFTPSVEAIAALNPDLVVLFYDPGDLVASLEGVGLNVILFDTASSIDDALAQMEVLGQATGHADSAAELVADMRARIAEISAVADGVTDPPSVFHEIDNTFYTAGSGSFIGDLYDTLGAENIANATGQPFPQMSQEAIIAADPDVIILADEQAGESPDTVAARPGWSDVAAVKEGRVHVVDPDILSRPGPRIVDALRTLATYLYHP